VTTAAAIRAALLLLLARLDQVRPGRLCLAVPLLLAALAVLLAAAFAVVAAVGIALLARRILRAALPVEVTP
jgi:hypothetical protein